MQAFPFVDNFVQEKTVAALKKQLAVLPQTKLTTQHLIHGGMYARTIFIPAGMVLTGANTKINNICIVSGDITVSTDKGVKRLTGYHVIAANAGYSRAGFAHADTYWTTLLETALDDVSLIEDTMTDDSASLQSRTLCITRQQHNIIKG